jgi:hypothetical protein
VSRQHDQPAVPREAAWGAVHEALPALWQVGPAVYSPERRTRLVSAHGPHPGRGKAPQTVTGEGEDEISALRSLDDQLRGVPKPDGTWMEELPRRLRLVY